MHKDKRLGACLLTWVLAVPAFAGPVPNLSGAVLGARQLVFDTRNQCEQIDIPDAPARAFRDFRGQVHLLASHFVARAMVGISLDQVVHDCHVVYRSPRDVDPARFQYKAWLYSFFTLDGRRIAALLHSEFDADEIPGMCATPQDANNCWWNTITFAESLDGGNTFTEPSAPGNLVASLPYRYTVGNRSSAYGYNMPTNILLVDGFYYALINDWPYKLQQYGPCLIRSRNVFDPTAWRGWDGTSFNVRFVDPYRQKVDKPADHVCRPVLAGTVGSLVRDERSGAFIVTQFAADDRFGGAPGFYIQGSRDLLHWSKPTLLVRLTDLGDPPGAWGYGYESLLDPASPDRNFSTVVKTPYLYYVRFDEAHAPYVRALFRRPIRLTVEN
jgi:hypothetical protein